MATWSISSKGLAKCAEAAGLPLFYVGDMAQPRGGPLPFGHASHQTGLDVDIWFTAATRPEACRRRRARIPRLPSMIVAGDTPACRYIRTRQAAAADRCAWPPTIRGSTGSSSTSVIAAMCRGFGGATVGGSAWLQRLRPWWGHDDHFHVRLRCPDSSPDCEPQKSIPDGDGCDASLEDWTHHLTPPKSPPGPRAPKIMPAACAAISRE